MAARSERFKVSTMLFRLRESIAITNLNSLAYIPLSIKISSRLR
jgi:hypothetical protein